MLDETTADKIIDQIKLNHAFNQEVSVPFHTSETIGYIPKKHLDIYRSCDEFEYSESEGVLRFAPRISGFEAKTKAFEKVIQKLIASALVKESQEPHFQERAVGGDDRLANPEFKINRAYYRLLGFPADGIFVNIIINDPNTGNSKVLLQLRSDRVEAANTFDFAAGGAIKYPQDLTSALSAQAREELGVDISGAKYLGKTAFIFSTIDRNWVTSNTHNLFGLMTEEFNIGSFNREEVTGFNLVSPEEAVRLCATGEFNRQNVQSFITSLDRLGVLPKFPGVDRVRQEINKYCAPEI